MLLSRTRCLLQTMLLLLLSTTPPNCAIPSSSSIGHGDDKRALMAFKAKISSHFGVLASWNQSTNYCSWEGVICGKQNRWRVVALDLSSQELTGTISPTVSNLTFLRSLNLSFNSLRGDIPTSIGSLSRLQILDLSDNMLTGIIPSNITRCTNLRVMAISNNNGLQGSIPAKIGNMPSLTVLELYNNSITGTIPSSFGNLSQLTILYLKHNHLEGSIPVGIGNNPYLCVIRLSSNNLTGPLPPSLYNLSSLYAFSVANNKLYGRLPSDMGKILPSIQQFVLDGNQFTGAIPLSLNNLTMLEDFGLTANKFTGVVPSALGRLQNLEVFALDDNMFEAKNEQEWGFIASLTNCSKLEILTIGWNRFAGTLPRALANLSTSLQWLRAPFNNISGVIPEIKDLASLELLDFRDNLLTGAFPESIGKLTRLISLPLDSNNLSVHIPSSIGNLTSLYLFGAHSNSLEGPIPSSIGNLRELLALDLSKNKLTGLIPYEIMELPSISELLDLSHNLLEGPLPTEVGNLVNLEYLSLSGNKLSGEIPDTIGNCIVLETLLMDDNLFQGSIPGTFNNIAGLTLLNLTTNKLNGSIPGNLGTITNLQELYLAQNNLSGPIPENLGNSKSLCRLDLSFNNLQGEVPTKGVFKNLTGLSIIGNSELCGGIQQLRLPKCSNTTAGENKKSMPKSLRIAIPTAGAPLLLLSGLVFARYFYRKFKAGSKKEVPPQFKEIELPIVPYNDILKGTDGFSEANVLGKGRYGTVYRGTLGTAAIVVAVKVFNLQQSGSYKSFQAECEALRRVRHRCLVKIITCCSSINHQGEDFRALVFEFMPNGSLDRWIHSDLESQNGIGNLSLSQRLDIAIDIVDALDYLHNGCQPSIIHCDLKPSNILLDQDMRARVGDFGIARVVDEGPSKHAVNSNSSIGIRGSIGYVAPEYGEGLAVSTYGDVYSFGITLIEMFTAKSPTDNIFRDGLSLHYFAEAALPDKVMEIADSNLWLQDGASNNNETRYITRAKECLAAVIQLGVLCSKQLTIERLSAGDAAAEMHAIRDEYITTQQSDVMSY